MILLDATTKTLEVVLSGAITTTQPTITAHFVDLDATLALSAATEADAATNSTTAVTAVSAPTSGHVRQVKYLSVYNGDTVAAIVTVQINNNSTVRKLVKTTLQTGETLEYVSE